MLYSPKRKFVFVHIPKTAGTSVMEVFLPVCRWQDKVFHGWKPTRKVIRFLIDQLGFDGVRTAITGVAKHAKACEIRDWMGPECYSSCISFAFVRDPRDLLVSYYFFLKQSKSHFLHREVAGKSFSEFVAWHLGRFPPRQVDYLIDPESGERIVEIVGRFENLAEEVSAITERLGIVEAAGRLGVRNSSRNREGMAARDLFDEESSERVQQYFAEDFRCLGYGIGSVPSGPIDFDRAETRRRFARRMRRSEGSKTRS